MAFNVVFKPILKVTVYSGSHPQEPSGVEAYFKGNLKVMTHKRSLNDH